MVRCWECNRTGHRRANCPLVLCKACGLNGHLTQNCQAGANKNRSGKVSTAHCLPSHWAVCLTYGSSFDKVTIALARQNIEYYRCDADTAEYQAVERLVQDTWREGKFNFDRDGMRLRHVAVEVTKVERIENLSTYEQYSLEKQDLLNIVRGTNAKVTRVENITGSSGPVWTTSCMKTNCCLSANVCPSINEHYLFHGTKEENVKSVAKNGFSMAHSRNRSLMGAALYFAESSTKADMYADDRENRTEGPKQMFLARVLLGEAYVRKAKKKRTFERPPCKRCYPDRCDCPEQVCYDSIIGDSVRPFRVFAVYKSSQCYPEYLITYQRLRKHQVVADHTTSVDKNYNQTVSVEDAATINSRAVRSVPDHCILEVDPDFIHPELVPLFSPTNDAQRGLSRPIQKQNGPYNVKTTTTEGAFIKHAVNVQPSRNTDYDVEMASKNIKQMDDEERDRPSCCSCS